MQGAGPQGGGWSIWSIRHTHKPVGNVPSSWCVGLLMVFVETVGSAALFKISKPWMVWVLQICQYQSSSHSSILIPSIFLEKKTMNFLCSVLHHWGSQVLSHFALTFFMEGTSGQTEGHSGRGFNDEVCCFEGGVTQVKWNCSFYYLQVYLLSVFFALVVCQKFSTEFSKRYFHPCVVVKIGAIWGDVSRKVLFHLLHDIILLLTYT